MTRLTPEFEADIRGRINPHYVNQRGTESYERAALLEEIDTLRQRIAELEQQRDHWKANHDNLAAKLRLFTQRKDLPVDRLPAYGYVLELERQLETERMRLAACGVVALANTAESASKARDMQPEYWSAACGDVADAVDREMALRVQVESLQRQLAERGEPVAPDWYNCPTNADIWRESPSDCDIIDGLADDPVVGMTFDLDVCWSGTQTFRITKVDGSDVEVEMISRPKLYTGPQPVADVSVPDVSATDKSVPDGMQLVPKLITEEMHKAACRVLIRADGLDGLPQRMLDAMLAAAPEVKP